MDYQIIFSKHALYQIKGRGLLKAEITETIYNPDKFISQSFGKYQAIKMVIRGRKKYLIIVVYRQDNHSKKVITAFLTSKFNKYLFK